MSIAQVSKCQSLSTTILSRTTLTWIIILHLPCVLIVFIATVPEHFLSMIICQLSWIIQECPGYGTDLPLFCTGHQISLIKWTFELFCASVWNLAHFFSQNSNFFIHNMVSGTFLHIFSHWKRLFLSLQWWKGILIACALCKTSYTVKFGK